MPNCLNCDTVFNQGDLYCSNCGQKTQISELKFWNIVIDFFKNLFNIDSKIWNTFKAIWIPAKLTRAFVEGKRKSYYNPLRIFLVTLFAFFTLFVIQTKDGIKDVDKFTDKQHEIVWQDKTIAIYDSLKHRRDSLSNNLNSDEIDSFKMVLFDMKLTEVNDKETSQEEGETKDSLTQKLPEEITEELKEGFKEGWNDYENSARANNLDPDSSRKGFEAVVETLEEEESNDSEKKKKDGFEFYYATDGKLNTSFHIDDEAEDDEGEAKKDSSATDSIPKKLVLKPRRGKMTIGNGIDAHEFFTLTPEEVKEKHGKGKWYRELFFVQLQKIMENLSSSISFFIGNGTWAILVTILLMALLFKLLYVRHHIYYVEHFIFHLYGHTRLLMIAIIALIIDFITGLGWWIMLAGFFAGLYYLYMGMYRYYGQSKRKTFFKYFVVLNIYVMILSLCSLLILAVSFVVF